MSLQVPCKAYVGYIAHERIPGLSKTTRLLAGRRGAQAAVRWL